MCLRRSYILCLFLALSFCAFGNWTPLIITYSRNDYEAGSKNWQIVQRNNHWMYFANQAGILEFNGTEWSLYPLDNNADGRSLLCAADNRRIYVGGVNEFGYLEPDAAGCLQYTNLSLQIPRNEMGVGNVWKIYEADNTVYFCGDYMITRWAGDRLQNIGCPDKVDCSGFIKNTLYIGTKSGLYVLAGDTFYPLPLSDMLVNKKLRAIIPFNNAILVAASDALYLIDNNSCRPFKTTADRFIHENGLFSVAACEHTLAIGTVRNGVVLLDSSGKALNYFNESHGLHDNTVLSLYFDADRNLWLGQDNGIAFIALHYPLKNLYTHPNFYGSGYTAALYNNQLYLGTNRGLYTTAWLPALSENAPNLKLVNDLQGQVWQLTVVDGKLVCCMDMGLFIIDRQNNIEQLELPVGVWSFRPMHDDPSGAWLSTYNGFYTTRNNQGKWGKPRLVGGLTNYSVINYEEIEPGTLLLRVDYNDFVKATLNDSRTETITVTHLGDSIIPANSFIYKMNDKDIACTRSGFFEIDDKGGLRPAEWINQWSHAVNWNIFYRSLSCKDNLVAVLGDNVVGAYNEKTQACFLQHHAIPLITNFEEVIILNDSVSIIPNENGFAFWNMLSDVPPSHRLQILKVESVKSDTTVYVNSGTDSAFFSVPYENNSLYFHYNLLDYTNNLSGYAYSCQLDDGPWVKQVSAVAVYENIGAGKHTFRVKVDLEKEIDRNADNNVIVSSLDFRVLPPWYQTFWAYVIYMVLLTLLGIVVWYWDDKRIKSKKRKLELKQQHQIQLKEEEINRLKTEQLEMAIKHKNQELANTAISLARKNEMLSEIKSDLLKVSENIKTDGPDMPSLRRKILRLNNKINDNILQDDSLKKFEEHFDLVHDKFLEHLTEKYPDLTTNERKMCAFIKMNLSSKEIAPLLNISIRGVETLRYRLRKKIGLKQDESLINFLNKFKKH